MNTMNVRFLAFVPSLLIGCQIGDGFEPYYDGDGGPTLSSVSVESEVGNVGGAVVTIEGSNFGGNSAALTVLFGDQNADIQLVDSGSVTVVVPHGPLQGGAVDVVVATAGGMDKLVGGYTYEVEGSDYEELAYIALANDFWSCYGGVGRTDLHGGGGNFDTRYNNDEITEEQYWAMAEFCSTFSYTGLSGTDGQADFLEQSFPRLHAGYSGGLGGFGDTSSVSIGEWNFQEPTFDPVMIDLEGGFEDNRVDVGAVRVTNRELSGEDDWCLDDAALASFDYIGGDAKDDGTVNSPLSVSATDTPATLFAPASEYPTPSGLVIPANVGREGECDGTRVYQVDTMEFCPEWDYDSPQRRSDRYMADYPIGSYLYAADGDTFSDMAVDFQQEANREGNGRARTGLMWSEVEFNPAEILIDVPNAGLSEVPLALPEYAMFRGTGGFAVSEVELQNPDWSLYGLTGSCADSNGDGVTTGDDTVFAFEWEPSVMDLAVGAGDDADVGQVVSVNTFVRAQLAVFTSAWYGGEGLGMRAEIQVPDAWNVDEETGRARLEVPADIVYRFPTSGNATASGDTTGRVFYTDQVTGRTVYNHWEWGDPELSDASSMFITVQRVTEYRIRGEVDGKQGDIVVAYSTGDIGFFGFENPLETGGACGDCLDNDGDGWSDDKDPDCAEDGGAEDDATFGLYTCNDGLDNDEDGFVDAEDDDCTAGDDEETNCYDRIDNDEDGWVDAADGECADGGAEAGADDPRWLCNDTEDNDADGWIDADDPDCVSNDLDEEGLSDFECNDGVDNDGHGDVDADDAWCQTNGADSLEAPDDMTLQCIDEIDNDGDGFIDSNDPDCEAAAHKAEYRYPEAPGAGIPKCYNSWDDDGDGWVDAEDPGCLNAAGEPDGYGEDEDAADPGFTPCDDAADNDGDGWIDGDDPDCLSGSTEDGFGATACNDGVDNDVDTFSDADDPECSDASDEDEGA